MQEEKDVTALYIFMVCGSLSTSLVVNFHQTLCSPLSKVLLLHLFFNIKGEVIKFIVL